LISTDIGAVMDGGYEYEYGIGVVVDGGGIVVRVHVRVHGMAAWVTRCVRSCLTC
jgi:hypothetical protein